GIRDFHVTGVQTCALPISDGLGRRRVVGVERQVLRGKTRIAGRLLRKLLQNLGEVPKLRSSELRCVGVRILDSDDPGEVRLNDRLPVFWVCRKSILGDTEQNSLR